MPKPFKQIGEPRFVDKEWRWTYELKITFNYQPISQITITSHCQEKPGREWITHELICEILELKLHDQKANPMPDSYLRWGRNVFKWHTTYQGQRYRFWFWFKDGTTNHLWIRNIHPC